MKRLPAIRDVPWLALGVLLWVFVDWPRVALGRALARLRRRP